jgi:hypothetical protein
LFPSFAGGNGNTFRRVLGVAVWAILTGLLLFAGVRVTDNNFEPAGERGAPGPGNLVETIPVLRDIGSDTVHDSRKEESAPSTDSNEKARTSLATVSVVAGSANAKQSDSKEAPQETAVANSPLPATVQIEMKGMPPVEIAQTADAATQFDSGASSARREPAPIGEGLIEGKETLKNLNRTQLPSQFLGTPFGTATSDVANLVNWTEYGGRLRRKATLVGAPVEAVLISDHERRVMAGAYIRICPRSTESLAPFLEWAVGVQGAIDAEYGEPSSVHEVSEADDAAGVVERIATGKDFYEAMWERQSDEGLIVLSIRAFNERSVVFRLEYLHRAMLAAYTEHQKEEARQKEETQRREETQQKAEGVSQQQESAQDQRSSPARN